VNVLFIQDNGINESLSLCDCAALLRTHGHECKLLISRNERDLIGQTAAFAPDVFIIPCDIWGERAALGFCTTMKQHFNKPMVLCGTYPLLYPEVVETPDVDVVAIGESEFALLDLVEAMEANRDITNIPNLHVKQDGNIFHNPMRQLLEDLSVLPLPARDIYFHYPFMKNISLKRFTSGRGCPNACSFCYNDKFRQMYKGKGRYVRRKPVGRVIEELLWMKNNAPMDTAHFSDDLFTDDKPWVLEFCREYGAHVKRPFTCNTTVNAVDEETVAALRSAGCSGIAIGVETGREKLRLQTLNKPFTDDEIINIAALIKKHGMILTVFTMLALPGETIEHTFETVRLTRSIHADNPRIVFISPIPRTTMTENAIRDGLLDSDYSSGPTALNTPVFKSRYHREFMNLYYLYDFALISEFAERIVRKIIRFKLPGFLKLLVLPRMLREKRFFGIRLLSGLRFYWNTDMPQNRTKNFNNYLP